MKRIVIGLVGGPATGKGEISRLLAKKGFYRFSLSDVLRELARVKGLPVTRRNLTDIANNLRAKKSPDYLALEAVKRLKKLNKEKIVIESIRHPEEVKTLQRELGAFIIGVRMPLEKRWDLIRERARTGDPKTHSEFLKLIESEEGGKGADTNIQVGFALDGCDVIIENNSSIEDLDGKVIKILNARKLILS